MAAAVIRLPPPPPSSLQAVAADFTLEEDRVATLPAGGDAALAAVAGGGAGGGAGLLPRLKAPAPSVPLSPTALGVTFSRRAPKLGSEARTKVKHLTAVKPVGAPTSARPKACTLPRLPPRHRSGQHHAAAVAVDCTRASDPTVVALKQVVHKLEKELVVASPTDEDPASRTAPLQARRVTLDFMSTSDKQGSTSASHLGSSSSSSSSSSLNNGGVSHERSSVQTEMSVRRVRSSMVQFPPTPAFLKQYGRAALARKRRRDPAWKSATKTTMAESDLERGLRRVAFAKLITNGQVNKAVEEVDNARARRMNIHAMEADVKSSLKAMGQQRRELAEAKELLQGCIQLPTRNELENQQQFRFLRASFREVDVSDDPAWASEPNGARKRRESIRLRFRPTIVGGPGAPAGVGEAGMASEQTEASKFSSFSDDDSDDE